jgi:hypothetical protein
MGLVTDAVAEEKMKQPVIPSVTLILSSRKEQIVGNTQEYPYPIVIEAIQRPMTDLFPKRKRIPFPTPMIVRWV